MVLLIARQAGDGAAGLDLQAVATAIVPWRLTRGSGSKDSRSASLKMRFTSTVRRCNGTALLFDIAQLFAEEDQAAIFLAQRHMHVIEHFFDNLATVSSCEGAVTEGCIRLATFCTDTGSCRGSATRRRTLAMS